MQKDKAEKQRKAEKDGKFTWASFVSGGGTTFQQIYLAIKRGDLDMNFGCLIASKPGIGAIEKALAMGISRKDIVVVNPKDYNGNEDNLGYAILDALWEHEVDIISQNGWIHKTPAVVIDAYEDRAINQHPAPVPWFGGRGMYSLRPHYARLKFAERVQRDFFTEAVAQVVDIEYDKGAVLKCMRVPILAGDTAEVLQKRVLPIEHIVQIEILQDYVRGAVQEVKREKPLVLPEEEGLLEEIKKEAIINCPV